MTNATEDYLNNLVEILPALSTTREDTLSYWHPEEPPITTAFAEIGQSLADMFIKNTDEINIAIFSLIESGIVSEDEILGTAVATGLLEGIISRATRVPGLWEKILPFLGKNSLFHANGWMNS
jgi:hypothetical protein